MNSVINNVEPQVWSSEDLIFSSNVFGSVTHDIYEKLRTESEYAAWLYIHGFRANHFTVSVNGLKGFDGIENTSIEAQDAKEIAKDLLHGSVQIDKTLTTVGAVLAVIFMPAILTYF